MSSLSNIHDVQFDVLLVVRQRRDSIRRILTEKHWHGDSQHPEDCSTHDADAVHPSPDSRLLQVALLQR